MYYLTRIIYQENPELACWEFTLMRSVIGLVIMLIYLNVRIKEALFDNVGCGDILPLLFRVFQNAVCVVLLFVSLKYFPVNGIGAANVAQPGLTLLLGYIVLKERLDLVDVLLVAAASAGMFFVVYWFDNEAAAGEGSRDEWAWICIFTLPVLMALGNITMRVLRQLHETTVATYQTIALAAVSVGLIIYYEDSFSFWQDWDFKTWGLVVGVSALQLLGAIAKFSAYKEHAASHLQVYAFLPMFYQAAIDLFIFENTTYVSYQWIGLACIAAVFVVQFLRHLRG